MKGKILGLLAVGLLAGPIAANAAFVYSLTDARGPGTAFVLTTASLISANTTFQLSDFQSITVESPLVSSVSFVNPLLANPGSNQVLFDPAVYGAFWTVGFTGPGTYCSGNSGCDYIMTIREIAVPEPGTLALLGLGLAGLGLSRRRKAI